MSPAPAQGRGRRLLLLVVTGLASIHLGLQLWQLGRGTPYVVSHLTIDDTFYYLQTAWLTTKLHFVTFDGLHATNGVQLLWFGICLLLAAVSPTRISLLYAALAVGALLNVACHALIWRIGALLSRPALALWMSACWLAVSLGPVYSRGLENSLHALVFWWVVAQVLAFLLALERKDPAPSLLPLTLALVVNAWVRLDAGLYSAILYAGCVGVLWQRSTDLAHFRRAHGRALALSLLLAAAGFAGQIATFAWMAGSPLPVSAIVKSTGAALPPQSVGLQRLVEVLPLSVPPRFPRFAVLAAAAAGLTALALVWRRSGVARQSAFSTLWLLLLLAFVSYHLVIVVFDLRYPAYFSWYRSPLFVFWILCSAGLWMALCDRLARRSARAALALVLSVSLIVAVTAARDFHRFVERNTHRRTYLTDLYEAALWLSAHSTEDTVFAAWNTGLLGYFSNRTFINLDGLVNTPDYHRRVLQSPRRLEAYRRYLREQRVEYIVDVVETDDVRTLTDDWPVVRTFSRDAEWGGWRMWKVRADATPLREPGPGEDPG